MIKRLKHEHADFAVQRPGWFIAKQHIRALCNGAGDRYALLLAARKLGWKMVQPMRKTD